jgi:hypothetical protein
VTENQWLRRAAKIAGYLVWFIILVQVMFLSTDNPYTSPAEIFGSHVGHAFWLLVLALIPYFMARARAKKNGGNVSWPYVMTGVTLIAFVLSIGGFYGRLATKNNSSSVSASSNASSTQPIYDSEGWTEESTGTANFGPWLNYSPAGTRYYRDANDIIFRVYPPGVKPDAPPANPFGIGDSTDTIPPASTDPPGTLYEMHADGTITKLTPVKGDPFAGQAPQQ